jgi:hypothetical protein
MVMSREYTRDEVREKLINHIRALVDYWAQVENRATHEKLSGLAFSILNILDGGSAGVPGFLLIPHPHPEDKQFHIDNGENWFPNEIDIGGGLHEIFYPK